jgi:hypothetical protein
MYLMYAATLFLLGALGGLYLATLSFKGKTLPMPVAVLHGLAGAAGLLLLIVAVMVGMGGGLARIALAVLLAAALGGLFLLSFHLRKQQHPRAVIVVHALVAVIGLLILVVAMLQPPAAGA